MVYRYLLILFFINFSSQSLGVHEKLTAGKALCIAPVADLFGQPTVHHNKNLQLMPFAYRGSGGKESASLRVHQLLFNEIVTVKEINGNQALIEIPNLFYETVDSKTTHNSYWTLAKNLVSLKQLETDGIPLSAFPHPLSLDKNEFSIALDGTITLIKPFFNPITHTTYSAGSRFVVKQATDQNYFVFTYDPAKKRLFSSVIPKKLAVAHTKKGPQEQIADFVTIARSWAHNSKGLIPYVWGGSSIIQTVAQTNPYQEIVTPSGTHLFTRTSTLPICTGIDCTGLVCRATQAAGIPYFYKNSVTAMKNLQPLTTYEVVENGDLFWIPGHVMIISSVDKSLLIEARHYNHGYGYVHEIPLNKQFKGINNYHDLEEAFFKQKPLERLNKQGTVEQVIKEFKLLKLASVWQSNLENTTNSPRHSSLS